MLTFLIGLSLLDTPGYVTREVEGWTLQIQQEIASEEATAKALELLQKQLAEVRRVVPAQAVTELQKVKIWISPEYPGIPPRAEYHPGAQWLRDNKRNPAMAKGIEITNVRIFEAETRRMPNFALHELAHAYHDRVLKGGFGNGDVRAAYEKAKASKSYDDVERQDSEGKRSKARAYAMTNPQEYFAELTEAYFTTNDFFPFKWSELVSHDPTGYAMIRKAWGVPDVSTPPSSITKHPFYGKFFDADGYPVISSSKVNDYALKETGYLINLLLARRPDVKAAMVASGSRMVVIGYNEFTTDVPEYSRMTPKDFWDARARGLGGSETDPVCSCAEENVLGYPGDPYSTESIVIHEFAHNIHLRGLVRIDKTFQERLDGIYAAAMKAGLWKGKYASTNSAEYFAEGVQSWFDNNRENDHDHNHVNTRAELIQYDPALAALCKEVFGETELRYSKPATRLTGHLEGYDPAQAPKFSWPERLLKVKQEIIEAAKKRGGGG